MKKYDHPNLTYNDKEAVMRVLDKGILSGFRATKEGHSGGEQVQLLEEAFCNHFEVRYAVAMNSATSCLHAAMIACGVGEGDEVITTPFTFSASASCALMVGAKPVFADIDEDTFNIDPTTISVNGKTKAIVAVHLQGHPVDMDNLPNVGIIEDAAQAIGATYKNRNVGTMGRCGIFSFNQSKPVTSGEGGMLVTNDKTIAETCRLVRNHGETQSAILGYNYRMGEMEAALLLEQIKNLDWMNEWRITLADLMTDRLSKVKGITPPVVKWGSKHTYYTYAVKFDKDIIGTGRDDFQRRLADRGVYFGNKDYGKPLYLQPIYKKFGYKTGISPVAERMWSNEIMVTDRLRFPMTLDDVEDMVDVIQDVVSDVARENKKLFIVSATW